MLGRTDRPRRLIALLVLFVVVAGALTVRLSEWQIRRAGELQAMAQARLEVSTQEPVQRGDILDRTGKVLLATTGYRDRLAVYPDRISKELRAPMAAELRRILALTDGGAAKLTQTLRGGSSYAVLARELTPEQSAQIRDGIDAGRLEALELQSLPVRIYPSAGGAPDTTLASHLLGFVNREGVGQYGVEQRYQGTLAGSPRRISSPRGAGPAMARVVDAGKPGSDLRLTLDASLQLQVEKEVYAAWVADAAATVSAVVMDPETGEILAWASAPGYDANDYAAVARETPQRFLDPVLSDAYEPGSVMKILLAAAALESHAVTPATTINDTASLKIGRNRVDNADKKAMGHISFRDVIAHSRNVGVAKVAQSLGDDNTAAATVLHDLWHRLGIGKRTGVDVAGESAGIADDPAKKHWAPIDLANRSFGQGVAVTSIQLATAFSAIANGGRLVQPRVVARVGAQAVKPRPGKKVLDTILATELQRLMSHVVTSVPRYAAGTLIPGYSVGGKTGTAQIWDSKAGRWFTDRYNFSFVGFVGQARPDAVIAVRIGPAKPLVRRQGDFKLAITSYELFRRVALQVLRARDIPRAEPTVPYEGPGEIGSRPDAP